MNIYWAVSHEKNKSNYSNTKFFVDFRWLVRNVLKMGKLSKKKDKGAATAAPDKSQKKITGKFRNILVETFSIINVFVCKTPSLSLSCL